MGNGFCSGRMGKKEVAVLMITVFFFSLQSFPEDHVPNGLPRRVRQCLECPHDHPRGKHKDTETSKKQNNPTLLITISNKIAKKNRSGISQQLLPWLLSRLTSFFLPGPPNQALHERPGHLPGLRGHPRRGRQLRREREAEADRQPGLR